MKRAAKNEQNVGLGIIKPMLEVRDRLDIVQDHRDLALIRQLRADLKSTLTDDRRHADWTILEASTLLKTVVEFVGNVIDEQTRTDEGQALFLPDRVTSILSDLQRCLDDIPKGTLDIRLKPKGRTSGYTTLELDFIETLVTTISIIQTLENNNKGKLEEKVSLEDAAEIYAKRLKTHRIKFRGKTITAKNLLNFKRMPPGKRRVK